MGNISNFNVNKVDMRLSNYDYWDLYLADGDFSIIPQDTIISGDCLVAHYDFNNLAIYGGAPYSDVYTPQYGTLDGDGKKTLYSLTTWNDAVNTGYTLDTIGLTGIDNGLIKFDKEYDDLANTALLSALTGTTLVIPSGETRLCLTRVTGYTTNSATTEYITNGEFNSLSGWTDLGGSWSSTTGQTAQCLAVVFPANTLTSTLSQTVALTSGEKYLFSIDVLAMNQSGSTFTILPNEAGLSQTITGTGHYDFVLDLTSKPSVTNFEMTLSGYSAIDIEIDNVSIIQRTPKFIYPLDIELNTGSTVGSYAKLCGGFYQGYYKLDGNSYEVLPNRVPKTWTAEVWLRKPCTDTCTGETGTTLNEVYTGNTGFFLYFGTRAENKFWNIFEGLNTGTTSGCTSGATEWCTIPKETDVSVIDDNGNVIPLSPPPVDLTVTDNKFLFFSRAKATRGDRCGRCGQVHEDGYTTCSWTGGTGGTVTLRSIRTVVTDDRNPFLIYSRAQASSSGSTCGRCGGDHPAGETVCSYSGRTAPLEELDRDADLIDNALGFRITPEGAIGYRKLVVTATCVNNVTVTGCSVEESYSADGIIDCGDWKMISIRFVANETLDECELEWRPARKGKLMFYVNRRLIHVVDDFDEFIARRLMEHSVKQVAVPYNISLGGGTQGLIEEMTFDGQDPDDMGSCLQNNFAGTFIGDLSQFRFYICGMNYCDIKNNFEKERERYGLSIND